MAKLIIFCSGILLIHFLAGEAFEYDDVLEYDDNIPEAADMLADNEHDMQVEPRQILLNPQRRRERRKKRIAALIEITGLESCLFNHDKCKSFDYNETKVGRVKIWHCNCEMDFYDCLHRVNSSISNKLGDLHFTLHRLCYRNDHKLIGCKKSNDIWSDGRNPCIQYLALLNTPIKRQLFDSPLYNGEPIETSLYTVKDPRASNN